MQPCDGAPRYLQGNSLSHSCHCPECRPMMLLLVDGDRDAGGAQALEQDSKRTRAQDLPPIYCALPVASSLWAELSHSKMFWFQT